MSHMCDVPTRYSLLGGFLVLSPSSSTHYGRTGSLSLSELSAVYDHFSQLTRVSCASATPSRDPASRVPTAIAPIGIPVRRAETGVRAE